MLPLGGVFSSTREGLTDSFGQSLHVLYRVEFICNLQAGESLFNIFRYHGSLGSSLGVNNEHHDFGIGETNNQCLLKMKLFVCLLF